MEQPGHSRGARRLQGPGGRQARGSALQGLDDPGLRRVPDLRLRRPAPGAPGSARRDAERRLGGRLLGDVTAGLTKHFPLWRTDRTEVWDMRKRMQWCMTPLGMNMLAADAIEYAELELYLTTFDVGKPMSVPGIRH